MSFTNIRNYNFRNLKNSVTSLNGKEVFLIGDNGQGKTNFLEIIYLLCYGSSFRTKNEKLFINHNEDSMSVSGTFIDNDNQTNDILVKFENNKKSIYVNKKRIKDRKVLLSLFPCIIFSHEDISFINGPPERKRVFFNQTMSLFNDIFLDNIRKYKKVLKLRNNELKLKNENLLDIYDEQLAGIGIEIQKERDRIVDEFNITFNNLFNKISDIKEKIEITYKPSWNKLNSIDSVLELLKSKRTTDLLYKTTTTGPHRDRFYFILNNLDFSKIASTGQLRLLSLILRIAQAKFFTQKTKQKPILLLDDVLLELDLKKRENFVSYLPSYKQAFYTFLPDEPYEKYKGDSTMEIRVEDGSLEIK